MPSRTRRDPLSPQRARKHPSTFLFIAVQLLPLALLAVVYTRVSTVLTVSYLNGVSLQALLLASAVAGPLLGQTVSGPIFRSLEGIPQTDLRKLAATTLLNFPKAMVISAPIVALADLGLAWAAHLDWSGALALAGVMEAHLLFAGALVPAFARRSTWMIALAWSAYAAALFFFPTWWWAPAAAGFATQLVILVIMSGLRFRGTSMASVRAMLHGLVKGFAQATPLWALPIAVFIREPGAISPAIVFAILVPALLVYHVYYSTVATPLWRDLESVRDSLSSRPYSEAKTQVDGLHYRALRGESRMVILVMGISVLLVPYVIEEQTSLSYFIAALFLASAVAVILTAQLTRLSMLREGPFTYLAAAGVAVNLSLSIWLGASEVQMLFVQAGFTGVLAILAAVANRNVWRLPEHTMFWRTALGQ